MASLFISYRRGDSQSAAGRLADHLETQLPGVTVFRDVQAIAPGSDFVDEIERAVNASDVMLVVIGPRWLTMTNADGVRRLDDSADYHRQEILQALRLKKRVIPVLVDGASMPEVKDLPEELRRLNLARLNAYELSDKRWDYDVAQLSIAIRKTLGLPEAPRATPRTWVWAALAVLALPVAAVLIWDSMLDEGCDLAAVYTYPSGYYRRDAGKWNEYHDDRLYASFEQFDRDSDHVYLVDKSRSRMDTSRSPPEIREFYVRLPVCGGNAEWSYSNPLSWTAMYRVRPANR